MKTRSLSLSPSLSITFQLGQSTVYTLGVPLGLLTGLCFCWSKRELSGHCQNVLCIYDPVSVLLACFSDSVADRYLFIVILLFRLFHIFMGEGSGGWVKKVKGLGSTKGSQRIVMGM